MEQYDEGATVCPHCGYVEGTKAEEAIHMDPGTCLKDRYIIGRVLGYGGFGVTYIAWDQRLEQKVAVKEYLPSEFSTRMPGAATVTVFSGDRNEQFQQGLDKFVEEAKRLSKFQNEPGVVKIFDSFKENSTAYIIMEYLDGETLTAYLEREGLLTEEKAIEMLLPVMQSLQIVHEEGILHRDIAPDNIFITKAGEVKLIDFGASRYATTSHSRSLTVVIKPGYSPEEQYRSRGDQGAHTDVYALSATMYKMLTGITPPDALERRANIEQKKKDLLKDIHKLNKNVSRRTENAILNAMNVQIEDRTPNIQAFMDELYSEKPVARRYGKIKKIDVYAWPKWLKIGIPVCLIAFLLIGVLLLTGVLRVPSKYNDEVVIPDGFIVVPDVEGLNKDEALSAIADSGLIPRSEGNVISDYLEPGQIVLQTPVSGSYLEQNGIVNLTVSSGSAVQSPVEGKATVPYVVWDTLEMATEKLAQAGLGEPIVGESIYDDAVPKGSVIAQSEDVGTELPEGTQITLTISLGPKPFDMPNVVGMTWANAEKLLKDKGLNVSTTYENSSTVAENTVLRQDIAEKQQVCKGDKVTLTVSSGKPVIAVPNVVGKKLTDAKTTLTGKKFKVEDYEMYHNTVPAGTVISQNPEAGTSQIEGTTIKVFVSKGKEPVTVTNVVGKTESAAYADLVNQGFTVTSKYGGYHSSIPYGCVLSQSLPAGSSQYKGSTIDLTISKGPDWSSWSDTLPAEVTDTNYEIKSQTVYRYKTKLWKYPTTGVPSGYTLDRTTVEYGSWTDAGWKTSKPVESDVSQIVDTRTVTDRDAYTIYHYFYYRYYNGEKYKYTYGEKTALSYGGKRYDTQSTTPFTYYGSDSNGRDMYQVTPWINFSKEVWFLEKEEPVAAVTHTEWRQQIRNKTTTYHCWKWNDTWSEWSTTQPVGDVYVDTPKTQYSYRRK
ncbi:MAG: PASTA domain-containing protein [Clostridia bacterium]|nr:PASTA domain-containing protein [Clostridia bacterium]